MVIVRILSVSKIYVCCKVIHFCSVGDVEGISPQSGKPPTSKSTRKPPKAPRIMQMPQQNLNSRFENEISPAKNDENEKEAPHKVKKNFEMRTEKKPEKTGKERSDKYKKKKMKSSGHILPKKKLKVDGEKREKVKILDPINLDQTGIQLDDEDSSEQEESESTSEQNDIQLSAFRSKLRPFKSIAKDWSLILIRI